MYRTFLPAGLFVLGLAHIAIVLNAEEMRLGSQHVLNDPGKVVFHVFLLPIAAWMLTNRPISVVQSALCSRFVLSVS